MCGTCGCGNGDGPVRIYRPGEKMGTHEHHSHEHPHTHSHGHDHHHPHDHDHPHDHTHSHGHDHHPHHGHEEISLNSRVIQVQTDILSKNDLMAARNRGYLEARGMLALNLVSSPGSGKTSLLERTLADLGKEISFGVIEGDQQTAQDADRIAVTGTPVVQINTGSACHLEADMIHNGMKKLDLPTGSILMIENVGNLVCPAMFDLGENVRVVIWSVTEGEDKPIKYPNMFESSDLCLISKADLLPYVPVDLEKMKDFARRVKPGMEFITCSVTTGEGMDEWYQWLRDRKRRMQENPG